MPGFTPSESAGALEYGKDINTPLSSAPRQRDQLRVRFGARGASQQENLPDTQPPYYNVLGGYYVAPLARKSTGVASFVQTSYSAPVETEHAPAPMQARDLVRVGSYQTYRTPNNAQPRPRYVTVVNRYMRVENKTDAFNEMPDTVRIAQNEATNTIASGIRRR